MAENKDIDKAVKALKANSDKYTSPANYYNGVHDLDFATEKFINAFGKLFKKFALNLCPAVCDAVRDKLTLTGFNVEAGDKTIPESAWKIWQANRMGVRARQIHRESLVSGDAYAIVWIDPEKRTTIYPNRGQNCTVFYDEETPGKIIWGAKYWYTTPDAQGRKKARLNLLYPDRIERYITSKFVDSLPDKAAGWVEFEDDGFKPVFGNQYGVVPMFHFGNNADIGSFGVSEISQAIPVQNALNKSVLDMLVAMEFAAFRQRWASGIEIEYDADGKAIPPFTAGVEKLWVSENPDVKFGDFEAANLEQFLKVKEGFKVDMASVTGTPLYYFMQTTGAQVPSGESQKKGETRFINKVNDRQESFGQVWENLMSLALRIEGKGQNIRLFAQWEDPAPLSENEMLTNLGLKQQLGIPDEQLWMEAGYGEADIKKMAQAKADAEEEAVRKFNAGEDLGGTAE